MMFGKRIECKNIEGKPLVLQVYDKELALANKWINDPDATRYLRIDFGATADQQESWFNRVADGINECMWGIFWDGRHIGNASLNNISSIHRNAEYGILIGERDCWGKDIGAEVAKAVVACGFNTLNLEHIYAEVFLPNEGSKIALERAGFKEYGRKPGAKYVDGQYRIAWQCCLSRTDWLEI